jgi:hypothetical protein
MQKYQFDIFYGVPYALKLLGETSEEIAALTRLKSACPDALGYKLVNQGVNLISRCGT